MRQWINLVESKDFRTTTELCAWAESIGVNLMLEYEAGGNTLILSGLYREAGDKGAGAKVMDEVVKFADKLQLETMLDAEGGSEGLFRYYERWGFELEQHVSDEMSMDDNYGGPWVMYRLPSAAV